MTSPFDKVVVAGALFLIAISFLRPGGLITGVILGGFALVAWYGGKYLMQLEQSRRMGEKSHPGIRERIAGDSEQSSSERRWRR